MFRLRSASLNRMTRRPAVLVSVAAFIVLAACGGGSKSSNQPAASNASAGGGQAAVANVSTGGKLDPCKLMTSADVAAAVGKVKGNAIPNDNPQFGGSRCYYDAEGVPNGVTLGVYQSGNKTSRGTTVDAAAFYKSEKDSYSPDGEPQAGLGDDAYWIPKGLSLRVLKKNTYVTLTVGVDDPAMSLQKAKDLMLKLLAKF